MPAPHEEENVWRNEGLPVFHRLRECSRLLITTVCALYHIGILPPGRQARANSFRESETADNGRTLPGNWLTKFVEGIASRLLPSNKRSTDCFVGLER